MAAKEFLQRLSAYLASFIYLFLIIAEIPLNLFIVNRVSYTEIDWRAYMQEVEGFLNGTTDYYLLKGDTGPLVYPAGFVYVYSLLHCVTEGGALIGRAQYIFIGFYLLNLLLVLNIYRKTAQVPWYVLAVMSFMAYRVHSIFVLRLFNDPIAMLMLYTAINLFIYRQWLWGCVLFSLAVSVKMNILLFAPGLLVILLICVGFRSAIINIAVCAFIQALLALPFLATNPLAYVLRSFELQRQFLYKWTVNWRFLSEEMFLNRWFHLLLLLSHITMLLVFAVTKWIKGHAIGSTVSTLTAKEIVGILFTSNFIGMVFARSLHYQFYVWYYHTLPFLIWTTNLPLPVKLLLPLVIEWCWNVYPSTVLSSAVLHCAHFILLAGLLLSRSSPTKEHKM